MDEHLSFEDFSALPEKEKYAHFKNMQQKTGDHQPAMNAVPQSKENENKLPQQKNFFFQENAEIITNEKEICDKTSDE